MPAASRLTLASPPPPLLQPPPLDFDAALAPIAARAAILEPPAPHERRGVMRPEAAALLDRLLVRVARGHGALDVAVGEGLAALSIGDRFLRLGFSCLGDYARERLGIAERTAQAMAQLARGLETRPLLREAVRAGDVSCRKALTILGVAHGSDERGWVARARAETVRALKEAVEMGPEQARCADVSAGAADPAPGSAGRDQGVPAPGEDEHWQVIQIPMEDEGRARLEEAMALAGKLLGATSPRWQRIEAIAQEYLAEHPVPEDDDRQIAFVHGDVARWIAAAEVALEEQTDHWYFLDPAEPVPAPPGPAAEDDALHIDSQLRRLASLRDRWDDVLGHLAMLFKGLGLYRDARFASFGHYCAERLGMAERTVAQRAALARRLYALPALRTALLQGRLSYEKARLVARCADDTTVDAWIAKAEGMTCITLRREIEGERDAQTCARGEVEVRAPHAVVLLLHAAIRAAKATSGRWISSGDALRLMAEHFVETWRTALKERTTPHRRVLARDRGYCQVPVCSRAADHAHHIVSRSRGGSDDPSNLVSLCAAHHLHGVHAGYLTVRGTAPDHLTWELAVGRC